MGAEPPESLDGTIGRLTRQDALMQQEMAKDIQRRRQHRMRYLYEALKAMDEGTYGICNACGGEIGFERLSRQPEATLCSKCA